ncbi:Myotubularin-related protein 8, partial [Oopsacas minuta]
MEFIKISRVDGVFISSPYEKLKYIPGRLALTTTHIIFSEDFNDNELWIEYSFILDFVRLQLSHKGIPLSIKCKNFRSLLILFSSEQDSQSFYETLRHFVYPRNIEELSAFSSCPQFKLDFTTPKIGWNTYEALSEFARMGLPTRHWTISYLNLGFELCETYPRYLSFPKEAIIRNLIHESAGFRSKARLPTLTYFHDLYGTALCRSSQPLRFISKRSIQDEELIRCIRDCNDNCSYMYVVDLRPTINAIAQRAAGKGYECLDFYPNVKFVWGHIPNIHVVRDSFKNFQEVLHRYDFKEYEQSPLLENCEWLSLIRKLLEASQLCGHALVIEKANVLVHCSDGWDRTSQVSSITQILVEPFYRTIHGFIILIEKDWISFGHPFTKRCAHIQGDTKDYSPIFIQFLDAVWQIIVQFPTLFEFGESLLLFIANEVYRCKYGTFISESDKHRFELFLPFRTNSLWGQLYSHVEIYRNPSFDQARSSNVKCLKIRIEQCYLRIWSKLYCQYCCYKNPTEVPAETLSSLNIQNKLLADYIIYLTKEINQLESLNNLWNPPFVKQLEEVYKGDPRYPCLLCGNIYCLKCLTIDSSLHYLKSLILICSQLAALERRRRRIRDGGHGSGFKKKMKGKTSHQRGGGYQEDSAHHIVGESLLTASEGTAAKLPKLDSLKQTIQRQRSSVLAAPVQPTTLAKLALLTVYQQTAKGEPFLLYDSGADDVHRFLIFGTQRNLGMLQRSKIWL